MANVSVFSRSSTDERLDAGNLVGQAVHRNRAGSREGALERLFSFAFSNLVYAQIWEDPVVDMEGLAGRILHADYTKQAWHFPIGLAQPNLGPGGPGFSAWKQRQRKAISVM